MTPNDGVLLLRSPFHKSRLLVTKPRALSDLLVTHAYDFVKPKKIAAFLRKVLGDGLILVEGDVHKFQRKRAMPAFSFRHVKDLYPMMFRKALALTEAISSELAEQPQADPNAISGRTELNSWASKATLDIIGIAGMGKELNVLKNSDDPLVRNYDELLEPKLEKVVYFLLSAFLSPALVQRLPWKMNEMFERTTTGLKEVCTQNVRERREAIKTKGDDHFDILSLLIQTNDFSDAELVDQLLTFLAAGHETTSSALTWLCYLLAIHPHYQSRLRDEIRDAFPTNPLVEPDVDIASLLERLPLLNGVCNETLRLFPTVPISMRIALRDTTLLGTPIPRGTEIMISPWAVNRSKQLWGDNADQFVPERWIEDGRPNNVGGAESNYSLLTFLHGPRSCIGQGFAKAELRCLVAAFINVFAWELDMKPEAVTAGGVITISKSRSIHLVSTISIPDLQAMSAFIRLCFRFSNALQVVELTIKSSKYSSPSDRCASVD
jgi:cytochrome P450